MHRSRDLPAAIIRDWPTALPLSIMSRQNTRAPSRQPQRTSAAATSSKKGASVGHCPCYYYPPSLFLGCFEQLLSFSFCHPRSRGVRSFRKQRKNHGQFHKTAVSISQPVRFLAASDDQASLTCADRGLSKVNNEGIAVSEAWVDRDDQACVDYAAFCTTSDGLPKQPPEFFAARLNMNLTALDACCVCNGGDALMCAGGTCPMCTKLLA